MRDSRETSPGTREEATIARQFGASLRRCRMGQGLSLQNVEDKSGRRWKAVVVGSYERGDRNITLGKLYELAEWYGVPVWKLLPGCEDLQEPTLALQLMSHRVDDLERQWNEFRTVAGNGSARDGGHEVPAGEGNG